jgi:hypothetical protein
MTRQTFFAIATGAALLSLALCGEAMAARTSGNSPGGPAGPGSGPGPGTSAGHGGDPTLRGCGGQADDLGLDGPARRDFMWKCERGQRL